MTLQGDASMSWIAFEKRSLDYHASQIFRNGYQTVEGLDGRKSLLSPRQRRLVEAVSRAVNWPRYLRRKAIASYLAATYSPKSRIRDGYAMMTAPPESERIIALCERQIAIYEAYAKEGVVALGACSNPRKYVKEASKKFDEAFLHIPFKYDPNIAGELVAFCLSPEFLSPVIRYLGVLPILASIRILYSPNEAGDLKHAQLFHVDHEGGKQVKLLMALREVDCVSGPFTFVPAAATTRMRLSGQPKLQHNRIKDRHVLKHFSPDKWISFLGKPGDVLLVDTSNCFHFGSRPGAKPRFLLYAQYLDPFASHLPALRGAAAIGNSWAKIPPMPGRWSDLLLARRI